MLNRDDYFLNVLVILEAIYKAYIQQNVQVLKDTPVMNLEI